jgi:type IX secretion system PorP/SprF family membrane protein
MRLIILTAIAFILSLTAVLGQDHAQFNHYIANQGMLNPAYNGTRDIISGLLVHRTQWFGVEGAPHSQGLNVHGPIEDTNLGVGIVLMNDMIGFSNNFDFMGSASYKLQIDRNRFLSLGLQMGLSSHVYDGTKAITDDYNDPVFLGKQSKIGFNFGFGGYFYGENYFAGLSIPRFFSHNFNEDESQFKNTIDFQNLYTYLYGGYIFDWGDVKVKPTALYRFVYGAPLQFDVSANVLLMERLWVGLAYRSISEVVLLSEFVINRQFTVRYSFDYSLSSLNRYAKAGSHEIGLQFDFSFQKRAGMRSIRYF